MINLEIPKKLKPLINQARMVADNVFRPISRKYDSQEHDYPVELDMFAAIMEGMSDATGGLEAGAGKVKQDNDKEQDNSVKNGTNMSTVLSLAELCYGDTGLALTIPRQGLGNSAIAAVADDEQLKRFNHRWAAMAITEPSFGSDSAAVRTTARLDGDEYVLNGEKIFVTSGERADLVVVWATVDKALGRAAIKSFVVEKGTPGMEVTRLEKKLGIKASDTAAISFADCRIPKENLLGSPEVNVEKGFAGVMQTFDNTRPVVAAMAIGVATAALERTTQILKPYSVNIDYKKAGKLSSSLENTLYSMEADLESARLLTVRAAWMADNGQPNSMQASMAKAKAGRVANDITLKCVELLGSVGYSEDELIEKWSRDSKILDIFEGTQQIQQLIIARRLLGKSSSELK